MGSSGSSFSEQLSCMADSNAKEDAALRNHVAGIAKKVISSLPTINKKTRKLYQQLDPQQHPNFIYPLPNPTIAAFDPLKLRCQELKPEKFYAIHSSLVVFAPSVYWNGQFQVCCPCCKRPAQMHCWSDDVRRVCGLLGTYYLIGARYRCVGCPGKSALLHDHQTAEPDNNSCNNSYCMYNSTVLHFIAP